MTGRLKGAISRQWFLPGILAALLLGFFLPELELALNPGGVTRTVLIVALFLIAGFTLPSEAIRSGMKDIRLHLFIQGFLFVFTPLFFVLASLPFRSIWAEELFIGLFALAVLPTTISSCIVFTQVSGGNVTGTMFNAALANLLGVLLSPLLLSLFIRGSGAALPTSEVFDILKSLGAQMLLPIACGQLLRRFFPKTAAAGKKPLSAASSVFILFILFFSFSRTARSPQFLGNLRAMLGPFAFLALAHLALLLLARLGARLLDLSRESTISVLYTAPQKTLAVGVPLLSAYFAGSPQLLAVALLPLVFYHAWQLLVAGLVKSLALPRAAPRA